MGNKIFIDCGAHCGESILEAKRRFGNDIKIYSFEANTNLANALIEHFKNDSNVKIENKAVWIENSFIEFYLSTSWSDGSSVYKEKNSGGISENILLKVPCIDLSSFINNFDKDDYIILKIDIEGAEYELLNHMLSNNCLEYINDLFVEFHLGKITNITSDQHNDLINKLQSLGFAYADVAWEKENIKLNLITLYAND